MPYYALLSACLWQTTTAVAVVEIRECPDMLGCIPCTGPIVLNSFVLVNQAKQITF